MSSGPIIIGGIVILVFSIPGSLISDKVRKQTDPNISIQMNLVICVAVTIFGGTSDFF